MTTRRSRRGQSPYLQLNDRGELELAGTALSNDVTEGLGGKESRLDQAQPVEGYETPMLDVAGKMAPRQAVPDAPKNAPGRWSGRLQSAGLNPDDVLARRTKGLEMAEQDRDRQVSDAHDRGWLAVVGSLMGGSRPAMMRAASADERIAGQLDPRLAQQRSQLEQDQASAVQSDPNSPRAIRAREALAASGFDVGSMPNFNQLSEEEAIRLLQNQSRLQQIGARNDGAYERTALAQGGSDGRTQAQIASREREGAANRANRLTIEGMPRRRGGGGAGTGLGAPGSGTSAHAEEDGNLETLAYTQLTQDHRGEEGYDPATDRGIPDNVDPRSAIEERVALLRMSHTDTVAGQTLGREGGAGIREGINPNAQQTQRTRQDYLRDSAGLISFRNALTEVENITRGLDDTSLALASGAMRLSGNPEQLATYMARNPQAGPAVGALRNMISLLAQARSGKAVSDREREFLMSAIGGGQFVNMASLRQGLERTRRAADADFEQVNLAYPGIADSEGTRVDQPAPAPITDRIEAALQAGRITPEQAADLRARAAARGGQ